MKNKITNVQKLEFEMIKKATFNGFVGEHAVEVLMKHRDLWDGVIMDREAYFSGGKDKLSSDLIKLRDIADNEWNVDTMFILSSGKDDTELAMIANQLNADEVCWLDKKDAEDRLGMSPAKKKVMKLWWD